MSQQHITLPSIVSIGQLSNDLENTNQQNIILPPIDPIDQLTNDLENISITGRIKVLCIGDPHFKTNNVKEMTEFTNKLYQFLDVAQNDIDLIIDMGDTLDRHENIHVVPLTQAIKFLNKLSTYKKTYVLTGNHDKPNNSDFLSDYHPFVGIGNSNLIIVDKVMVQNIKDFKFVFVPYVYPGRFREALNTKKDEIGELSTVDCIYAHQELKGVKMGVVTSMIGDKWNTNDSFVISGHIHEYNRLQENVVYVGSPMQINFGDPEDKTISLFTFTKGQRIPEEQRIDLGLTKRIVCRVKCEDVITWIQPTAYLVKLIIEGTASQIKAIMKFDGLKKLVKNGIKIVYNTTDEINHGINKEIKKEELRLPYAQRLKNSVENNPGQKYWFQRIFGNPN